MSEQDRIRWDEKYRKRSHRGEVSPWIEKVVRGLPSNGEALDLACGDGAHAILLARLGWKVTAVDVSPVGLELGKLAAQALGIGSIDWVEADLDAFAPRQESDLILVSRFFDRVRLPRIVEAARAESGWLVCETYHERSASLPGARVTNPDFLVKLGEWRAMFPFISAVEEEEGERMSRFVGRWND